MDHRNFIVFLFQTLRHQSRLMAAPPPLVPPESTLVPPEFNSDIPLSAIFSSFCCSLFIVIIFVVACLRSFFVRCSFFVLCSFPLVVFVVRSLFVAAWSCFTFSYFVVHDLLFVLALRSLFFVPSSLLLGVCSCALVFFRCSLLFGPSFSFLVHRSLFLSAGPFPVLVYWSPLPGDVICIYI